MHFVVVLILKVSKITCFLDLCFGFALPRNAIGKKISRHFLSELDSTHNNSVARTYFPALDGICMNLHVFASSSDWFIACFTIVVTSEQSDYFGVDLTIEETRKWGSFFKASLVAKYVSGSSFIGLHFSV